MLTTDGKSEGEKFTCWSSAFVFEGNAECQKEVTENEGES